MPTEPEHSKIPQLKSSCCGCSLETGSKVIGIGSVDMSEPKKFNIATLLKNFHAHFCIDNAVKCVGYTQVIFSILVSLYSVIHVFLLVDGHVNKLNGLYEEIIQVAVISHYLTFGLHFQLHTALGIFLIRAIVKKKYSYVWMWIFLELVIYSATLISVAAFMCVSTSGKYFNELGIHSASAGLHTILIPIVLYYYRRKRLEIISCDCV